MRKILTTLVLASALMSPPPVQAGNDLQLPDLGGGAGALSLSQEKALGKEFMQAARSGLDIMHDEQIHDYLHRMGYRLLEHMNAPYTDYQFILVRDPNINAFAAPGGYVVVNSGLVLAADNASELASVIAHELSHINQRHISRAIDENQRLQWPMIAAMLAGILLSAAGGGQAGQAAMTASAAYGAQTQLHFSRDFEREADRIGIQAMAGAGYDPSGMPDFFEKLQSWNRLQAGNPMEFLSTHPLTLDRIADTRNRAAQLPKVTLSAAENLNFERFKTRVRALSMAPSEAIPFFRTRMDSSDQTRKELGEYGLSLALAQKGQQREAIAQLNTLIKQHPSVFEYQAALAQVLINSGAYPSALSIYHHLQDEYPDSRLVLSGMAQALLGMGDGQRAAILAHRLADSRPQNPDYQKLLARSLDEAGNKSDAHRALAEYYYLTGAVPSAIQQLEIARSAAGTDPKLREAIDARMTEMKSAAKLSGKARDNT